MFKLGYQTEPQHLQSQNTIFTILTPHFIIYQTSNSLFFLQIHLNIFSLIFSFIFLIISHSPSVSLSHYLSIFINPQHNPHPRLATTSHHHSPASFQYQQPQQPPQNPPPRSQPHQNRRRAPPIPTKSQTIPIQTIPIHHHRSTTKPCPSKTKNHTHPNHTHPPPVHPPTSQR